MSDKKIKVVADADAFIALFQPADPSHKRAKQILVHLLKTKATIFMPITAMTEAITVFQRKLSNPDIADTLTKKLNSDEIIIISVEEDIRELAISFFNPHGSKQNTFFDAIVLSTAKILKADAIFSFDGWYRKQSFKLAEDLIV